MNTWKRAARTMFAFLAIAWLAGGAAAAASDSPGLSLGSETVSAADGVASRVAIEEVLWNHRIWPAENPGPKPAFDRAAAEAGSLRVVPAVYSLDSGRVELLD